MFVFDRVRRAVRQKFDDIRLADQPLPVAKKRQGALDAQPVAHLETGLVHPLVQGLAALG